MAQVTMPDGQVVELPDNPTPEQLQKLQSIQAEGKPGAKELAKSMGMDLVRGAAQAGVGMLEEMPPGQTKVLDSGQKLPFGLNMLINDKVANAMDTRMPAGMGDKLVHQVAPLPTGEEPAWRRYVRAGLEGVGNMIAPAPGSAATSLLRKFAIGVGGGVGGQAGADASDNNPWARILGSFAGGTAAGLPGSGAVKTPSVVKATQEAVASVTPEELAAAAAKSQAAAATLGTDVMLPQGLENPTGFQGLIAELSQHPNTGPQTHRILNQQPQAAESAIQRFINGVSSKVPGQAEANQVQAAALREAVDRPAAVRQAAADRSYRAGQREAIPMSVRFSTPGDIEAIQSTLRVLEKSDAGKGFSQRASKLLRDSSIINPKTGKPFSMLAGDATELENFRKELSTLTQAAAKDSADGAAITKSRGYRALMGALDKVLAQNAPETTKGRQISARGFKVEEQIRQGPVGQMVPKGKDQAKLPGNWDELNEVLNNPAKYSPADVRKLAAQLHRSDPQAFPLLVRQRFDQKLNEARQMSGGRSPVELGPKLAEAVFGNAVSRERENILTAVEEVAKRQGVNPKAARQGAFNLISALEVAGRDKQGLGKITGIEKAAESIVSKVLKGPFYKAGQMLSDAQEAKLYQAAFDALTSKDGMAKLQYVAQYSLAGNRVKLAMQAAKPAVLGGPADQEDGQ